MARCWVCPAIPLRLWSAPICFLRPLIEAMLGRDPEDLCDACAGRGCWRPCPPMARANIICARACRDDGDGQLTVRAFEQQDSSLLSVFASANALIRMMPDAPAAAGGRAGGCAAAGQACDVAGGNANSGDQLRGGVARPAVVAAFRHRHGVFSVPPGNAGPHHSGRPHPSAGDPAAGAGGLCAADRVRAARSGGRAAGPDVRHPSGLHHRGRGAGHRR